MPRNTHDASRKSYLSWVFHLFDDCVILTLYVLTQNVELPSDAFCDTPLHNESAQDRSQNVSLMPSRITIMCISRRSGLHLTTSIP